MWQSAHARPFVLRHFSARSKNARRPRCTAPQGSPLQSNSVPLDSVRAFRPGATEETSAVLALITSVRQTMRQHATSHNGAFTLLPLEVIAKLPAACTKPLPPDA